MKQKLTNLLHSMIKSFMIGIAFGIGVFSSMLLAVSVVGTINTFSDGEVLSAAKLNTNFSSLKTAVEGIPEWVKGTNNVDAVLTTGKVGLGISTPTARLHMQGSGAGNETQIRFTDTDGGGANAIIQSYSGYLGFSGGATTDAMVLKGNNVGIGTNNPSATLDVRRSGGDFMQYSDDTNGGRPVLKLGTSANVGTGIVFNSITDQFSIYADNSIFGVRGGGYVESPTDLLFRIYKPTGYFGIGTSGNPAAKLTINQSGSSDTDGIRIIDNSTTWNIYGDASGRLSFTTLTGSSSIKFQEDGKVLFNSMGTSTSNTLCYDTTTLASHFTLAACSSSKRYKENINDLSINRDKILSLRPVSFKWRNRNENDIGLIAEEVHSILPELTTRLKGRIEGVKYDQLTVYLLGVLKLHEKEISDLTNENKSEISSLQKENTELKNRLTKLENDLQTILAQQKVQIEKMAKAGGK